MLNHGFSSAALRKNDAALDCTKQKQMLTIGLHVISVSAACKYATQAHVAASEQQGVGARYAKHMHCWKPIATGMTTNVRLTECILAGSA